MIPGDIDLTTNLDFRKDKTEDEKSYDIVPWKPEDLITFSPNNDSITTTYNFINHWQYDNFYYWYSNINIDNNISSNYPIDDNYNITISNMSYNLNRTRIDYFYEDGLSSPGHAVIDYFVNYFEPDEYYSWSNCTTYNDSQEQSDKSRIFDIFGKKKEERYHSPICPFCGKLASQYNHECRFDKNNNHAILKELGDIRAELYNEQQSYNDYDYVPWWERELKEKDSHRLCPWFDKMNSRIYNDYIKDLFGEQDYTEYLTNMHWLGL